MFSMAAISLERYEEKEHFPWYLGQVETGLSLSILLHIEYVVLISGVYVIQLYIHESEVLAAQSCLSGSHELVWPTSFLCHGFR